MAFFRLSKLASKLLAAPQHSDLSRCFVDRLVRSSQFGEYFPQAAKGASAERVSHRVRLEIGFEQTPHRIVRCVYRIRRTARRQARPKNAAPPSEASAMVDGSGTTVALVITTRLFVKI